MSASSGPVMGRNPATRSLGFLRTIADDGRSTRADCGAHDTYRLSESTSNVSRRGTLTARITVTSGSPRPGPPPAGQLSVAP